MQIDADRMKNYVDNVESVDTLFRMATKSPQLAQKSTFMASALYLAIGLIPVTLGLFGHQLIGDISHSDQFLPVLAAKILPSGMFIVFSGAMISAILSTADSNLLSVSGLLSHNILNGAH